MSERFFLDTNVFLYSFDGDNPEKRRIAQELISTALETRTGIISSQVVQEFLNAATRKFRAKMTIADARLYLDSVLLPLCEVSATPDLIRDALRVHEDTGYSLYDSLILAAAIEARCDLLITEDLRAGQRVRGILIRNPFAG